MFRRSRFSIRPNVGATGKTASTAQESPSASQETSETPNDVGESSTATAVTDNKPAVTPSETPTVPVDGIDQHVEGTSSSAALQRRKRFSIKPKVAPGRPSIAARKTRTPVKSASETPVSDHDKPNTSSQTGTASAPQRLQSPRRRRPSEESKQQIIQPKPTTILSEPSVVPTAEDSTENKSLLANTGKEFENISASQGNEASFSLPDKVPLSLPDKEAIAISEKARTLMSSKSRLSLSTPAFTLSRLLNDPSDLQRLAKAQKLRDLLREEMHKEKKTKRSKKREKEFDLDPAKMTMRDLIRYLPQSNPMTSSLEESVVENETVVPPSPGGQTVPEKVQEPEFVPKMPSQCEEEAEAAADEEEEEEEDDDDDAVMVPQVRVAEDGTLIIDEESLTVEVQRAKGPNPANERDPIFERGSTTTYSSFRKGTYCKPWSSEETDMFFLAISMVGTDFSMICQLFPLRARSEIKNKFKKEERENSWRIDKAFRERRKLDIEYFSKLLEKILEVQKNRKKLKAMAEKKPPKERRRKAGKKLSVVEEEDEEEQKENPDMEKEGEKENEDLCNEAGTTAVKSKKKRKIKNTSTEEPKDKKNKTDKKSNDQDEAFIPGDKEAALPEDCQKSDMSEKTEGAKDGTIKPAKFSRGRVPKPLLPLGRKRVQKLPPPSTKTNDDESDKGEESVIDGVSTEQVKKDASPSRQDQDSKSANNDHSSEEEEATVQPPKPTRYGRVPKPTKPLNYSAKEAASETSPASPDAFTASAARPKPKSTAKRRRSSKQQSSQESKKPKLVTLRASQSEYSDDEDEKQREEEELEEEQHDACSPSRDSSAPVFVPAILRSPHPVISEVEETMEELDILATMPDVLGISQNALCPDDSCEWAQKETGTAEPCEHQLDLLVDVIDFLSIDHAEVSEDESYNEAAQTLLTIGNLAHLSQSAQNQIAIEDQLTGTTSDGVNETSEQLEEEVATKIDAEKENRATPVMSATSVNEVTETSETVTTVELQNIIDNNDIPILESSDQRTGSDVDPTSQLTSKTDSPPTRRARLSKDASTSSAGGTQGHPSFTTFPDMMLPQDPSDPDEPFFILSLTEIPVSSSGERVDSVPEPLPSLPVTDAPIEQQSVPGESLATAEEQPSPNVTVPMEDSNETGVIHVKDPDDGSTEGNQVDPHERTTVHPSTVQETGQNKDETEIPPTKERQTGTRRRETAKPQVKPKMTKRKQTSKTAAAKKAESLPIQTDTTEQLEPPGPSVQPEASDDTEPQRGRADHVEVEKETLTDVVDPEGTSSGAKTTRTSSRNRKAKDSDPGKAASKSPKVKTPRAKGKKSTPAAVASTPCEVTPKPGPKPGQHSSEHSRPRSEQTPSTSLCPAEDSTSQPSEYMESSSLEEEPTSVSQYFLSDIFTDAESLPIQTDTTEQLELPGPSVQPEASDDTEPQRGRADHVEVEKETLTDVVDPKGTSSGAKTTRTSSRNRKAKDSDPGKAASKSPKVKTPRAKGNRSTPAAVASTPCEVTPKPGPKPGQHASEHSRPRSEQTPSTSLCPAEDSTSQPSEYMESSSLEEEPTSVSQYFLSDIFTDAEEG
ncbi:hypothetical protein CesoFtcFv8_024605 [Champsocephalus esox]|uniref:Myb-like domain-containing protein n=1 Tax=Champsocephalus esox TaxID=159716 RepID=A0AAN8B6U6_9TELE|nr:hypothetical protein CesoFtcFv8_024605 [Champsocephalus esox]